MPNRQLIYSINKAFPRRGPRPQPRRLIRTHTASPVRVDTMQAEREVAALTAKLENTDLPHAVWMAYFKRWREALDRL